MSNTLKGFIVGIADAILVIMVSQLEPGISLLEITLFAVVGISCGLLIAALDWRDGDD